MALIANKSFQIQQMEMTIEALLSRKVIWPEILAYWMKYSIELEAISCSLGFEPIHQSE